MHRYYKVYAPPVTGRPRRLAVDIPRSDSLHPGILHRCRRWTAGRGRSSAHPSDSDSMYTGFAV